MNEKLKPVSPVEMLITEFLIPWAILHISQRFKEIPEAIQFLEELVENPEKKLDEDSAKRLSKITGWPPEAWLSIQGQYDREMENCG